MFSSNLLCRSFVVGDKGSHVRRLFIQHTLRCARGRRMVWLRRCMWLGRRWRIWKAKTKVNKKPRWWLWEDDYIDEIEDFDYRHKTHCNGPSSDEDVSDGEFAFDDEEYAAKVKNIWMVVMLYHSSQLYDDQGYAYITKCCMGWRKWWRQEWQVAIVSYSSVEDRTRDMRYNEH